jgi:hypothetical protein
MKTLDRIAKFLFRALFAVPVWAEELWIRIANRRNRKNEPKEAAK